MKLSFVTSVFAFVALFIATSVIAQEWNRDQAVVEGKKIVKLMDDADRDLKSAVETSDSGGFVKHVTRPLSVAIQRWHDHKYPHELTVCHDSAIGLHGYAMTMYQEYLSGGAFNGVEVRRQRKFELDQYTQNRKRCLAELSRK